MDIVTAYRERALACLRAASSVGDPLTRALLLQERQLWAMLAREHEATLALLRAVTAGPASESPRPLPA